MSRFARARMSLKTRLGLGAALLGLGTLLTAAILWFGMNVVAARLDTALASENRMARYASLSTQASTFLVVSTEAIQAELSPAIRADRIAPVRDQIGRTFELLRADVQAAVQAAQSLGLDAQSRYGTQSLGLARMEAMLDQTVRGLTTPTMDKARLRAHVDTFASSFDPLLSQAVNTEVLFRNAALAGIDTIRQTLIRWALAIAGLTCIAVAAFYILLIVPQFRRLDRLRAAAHQIGQEDFAVTLPDTQADEIGELAFETRRMAAALAERKAEVQSEWARLNETIAERTEALRTANTRLETVDANRKRFFADVSHELRTPLTVILMEAQLGTKGAEDPATSFATIQARAERLNRRIDDLLRVAQSESGQIALEPVATPLPDLIGAVAEEVRAEVSAAGMQFTLPDAPKLTLALDANWMRQVLVGLVRNAITHGRDGTAIAILVDPGDKDVTIAVADNGPGISEVDQAQVFDRFVQGKSGNAQGFGIGLALARWVVEAHGGSISIQSPVPPAQALGNAPGTKISVHLPRV